MLQYAQQLVTEFNPIYLDKTHKKNLVYNCLMYTRLISQVETEPH